MNTKHFRGDSINLLRSFEERHPDFMENLDHYRKFVKVGNKDNPIAGESEGTSRGKQ